GIYLVVGLFAGPSGTQTMEQGTGPGWCCRPPSRSGRCCSCLQCEIGSEITPRNVWLFQEGERGVSALARAVARTQGAWGRTAPSERVWGDGRKWASFYFSCAFQNSAADLPLICSSPLRERSTSVSRSGW